MFDFFSDFFDHDPPEITTMPATVPFEALPRMQIQPDWMDTELDDREGAITPWCASLPNNG